MRGYLTGACADFLKSGEVVVKTVEGVTGTLQYLRKDYLGEPLYYRLITDGYSMFDCVLPTRNARNGTLFTRSGKVNIKRAVYRDDASPLDPDCPCYACRTFSKAYLRHLYIARELLSYRLNTLHNLTFFLRMWASAFTATRPTIAGFCLISKRCSTIRRCWP